MKMIMAVVPRKYGDDVLANLINNGYTATYSETRGGMLRQSQLTLFIAVVVRSWIRFWISFQHLVQGRPLSAGLWVRALKREPHSQNEGRPLGGSNAVVFIWTLDRYELP